MHIRACSYLVIASTRKQTSFKRTESIYKRTSTFNKLMNLGHTDINTGHALLRTRNIHKLCDSPTRDGMGGVFSPYVFRSVVFGENPRYCHSQLVLSSAVGVVLLTFCSKIKVLPPTTFNLHMYMHLDEFYLPHPFWGHYVKCQGHCDL